KLTRAIQIGQKKLVRRSGLAQVERFERTELKINVQIMPIAVASGLASREGAVEARISPAIGERGPHGPLPPAQKILEISGGPHLPKQAGEMLPVGRRQMTEPPTGREFLSGQRVAGQCWVPI